MKRRVWRMAAALALLACAPRANAQAATDEAVRAMTDWLRVVDAGSWRESWSQAAAPVRAQVNADAWEAGLRDARAPYAGAAARTLESAQEMAGPGGAPMVRMRFATRFASGTAATETVVALRDEGAWRVAGYFIAPRAAEAADYSAPAGAPYVAEEVRVQAGDHVLAGTLTLPSARTGRIPAVVLITGSGQQDRDSGIPVIPGYRFFRQIADTLSRRGIAVLRLDDRGVGGSGGDLQRATTADFADDVRAAVAYLRGRGEIDPARIGLAGHSEGGVIAPMVAADDPRIRAVALMAGTAYSGGRVLDFQLRSALMAQGLAGAALDSAFARGLAARETGAAQVPWMRWFIDHDPLPVARRVRAPVLVLQGATDRQVTPEQADTLAAAIRAGGNRDVTVKLVPAVNHLFLADPVGTADPAAYAALPDKRVPASVLGPLVDFFVDRLK